MICKNTHKTMWCTIWNNALNLNHIWLSTFRFQTFIVDVFSSSKTLIQRSCVIIGNILYKCFLPWIWLLIYGFIDFLLIGWLIVGNHCIRMTPVINIFFIPKIMFQFKLFAALDLFEPTLWPSLTYIDLHWPSLTLCLLIMIFQSICSWKLQPPILV